MDGVTLWVDGRPLRCRKGEPVASALIADDIRYLRDSPTGGTPRGAFCMMGACQECVADVDGTLRQTCLVPVRDGMRVTLAKRS
ncbi:(2Fe-2S)-binding protein [Acuticoccus sp.]|uniref:(2Fe-2S)-binding protein n=1 Tax=Acuticoccus sp. TaxID=1904378 RepID=UPI003B528A19